MTVTPRSGLVARNVTKSYRRRSRPVLEDVSLEVQSGELVSITGENGSGKSTLLGILAGDLRPSSGSVERPRRLGYCPQQPALYPRLSADEHIRLYADAARLDRGQAAAVAEHTMEVLQFAQFRSTQARSMSGGTRAKLSLLLSLLGDPDMVILDEPYAAFDLASYTAFWELLEMQRQADRAVIVVAHLELESTPFNRRFSLADGALNEIGG